MKSIAMSLTTRSLSPQESRVVLALTEHRQRDTTRGEIIRVLGGSAKAADHVIASLRRKGWLERAAWGKYLLVPPDQGPDAIGDSNLFALASRIVNPYCIGFAHGSLFSISDRTLKWAPRRIYEPPLSVGGSEADVVSMHE